MSEKFKAICTCGYSQDFVFGAPSGLQPCNRSNHFPYRCTLCGIVSVDISADELACPRGPKHKIMRMGRSRAEYKEGFKGAQPDAITSSFLQRIGIRKRDIPSRSIHISEPILSVDDHELYDESYDCPRCKKTELRFMYNGYYATGT